MQDNSRVSATPTPGEPWLWYFILGDMGIFGLFFGAYLWDFSANRSSFAADAANLLLPLGLINTLVLLTSSYFVVEAIHAHRQVDPDRAHRRLCWALYGAAVFTAIKMIEYGLELADGHGLTTSPFFMYYFVLTGLHLMHVAVGSILLIAWRRSLRAASGPCSSRTAESIAGYWHMVDLLWLVIFSLLYIGSYA